MNKYIYVIKAVYNKGEYVEFMNYFIYEISAGNAELHADSLKSAKEKLIVLKEFISKHYNKFVLIINRINTNTGDEKIIYRKEVLL